MLNLLNMTLAEYEEIRPELRRILADSAPLSVPDLHAKYMELLELSSRDASDCLWRMLDGGDLHINPDLKAELGKVVR